MTGCRQSTAADSSHVKCRDAILEFYPLTILKYILCIKVKIINQKVSYLAKNHSKAKTIEARFIRKKLQKILLLKITMKTAGFLASLGFCSETY